MGRIWTRPRTPDKAALSHPGSRPLGALSVNQSHKYHQRLIGAFDFKLQNNLASGKYGSVGGAPTPVFDRRKGLDARSAGSRFYFDTSLRDNVAFGTDDFLIFAKATYVSTIVAAPALVGNGDTGAGEWMLRYIKSTQAFQFYGDGGNINAQTSGALGLNSYDSFDVAVARVGSTVTVYFNGAALGSDSSGGADLSAANIYAGWCVADNNTLRWWNGLVEVGYIWRGVMPKDPADIIRDLHLDEYQLFKSANDAPFLFSAAGGVTLSIQSAAHAQASDNLDLIQADVLAIDAAAHAHASDNLVLTAGSTLAIQDTDHAQVSDNLDLVQANTLAIQESAHAHSSDQLTLDVSLVLDISDAAHAQIADNLDLVQANVLAILDAAHAHTADNVDLITASTLIISDALHQQLSDNLALIIGGVEIPETGDILVPAENRYILVAPERRIIKVN